jgi:hypothetical protein
MWHRDCQPKQSLEAGQETLRLAQRPLENRTKTQCTQDRLVAIAFERCGRVAEAAIEGGEDLNETTPKCFAKEVPTAERDGK